VPPVRSSLIRIRLSGVLALLRAPHRRRWWWNLEAVSDARAGDLSTLIIGPVPAEAQSPRCAWLMLGVGFFITSKVSGWHAQGLPTASLISWLCEIVDGAHGERCLRAVCCVWLIPGLFTSCVKIPDLLVSESGFVKCAQRGRGSDRDRTRWHDCWILPACASLSCARLVYSVFNSTRVQYVP